ncbi:MAG TPA: alpha/beta hydrolase [Acidimicrobiia bacterium]|nr:alpha/beta hydrolase [Acidimicrobiia bacterium]
MNLWDDELEALRPTLRDENAEMLRTWPSASEDRDKPAAERIAAQRTARDAVILLDESAVDREIPGPAGPIRLRTFVPDRVDGVLLHFHGGGWIVGTPEMMDPMHAALSAAANVAIVSVDYRLAPEHPFPAGPDDCEAAAVWLLEHAEAEYGSSRLLVGGESAGGHLAALTLLRMRDRHDAIDRFVGANLVMGVYDVGGTPSQRGVGAGPDVLDPEGIEFFTEMFTPGLTSEERRDPEISPLHADLHGLPPALFSTGAADHLVDDTLFLAARWRLAGNAAELIVYPESPHAFIAMPSVAGHFFPRLIEFLRGCVAA